MRELSLVVPLVVLVMGGGCEGKDPVGDGSSGAGSGGSGASSSASTGGEPTGGTSVGGSTAGTEGSADGLDGSSDGTVMTTGNDPTTPLDCGGTIYACGNGLDDDRDGYYDLDDPECTGPCDDDESSFATGIPGDNMDCKQDCFFDGNSGQGDDGCDWNLRCDPANPGANIGCEYTGGNNCDQRPPPQTAECVEFCEQFVPPGCDCFGCCTVQTPQGSVDIFLNSDPECSLDNLEACQPCTSQAEQCGNPCIPGTCQVCFGETELPEGCDEPDCNDDLTCDSDHPDDCPGDYFCLMGCCYPPPPG